MNIWEQTDEQRIAAAERRWTQAWTSANPERAAQWHRRAAQVAEANARRELALHARAA